MKKTKTSQPSLFDESKRQKFVRLANARSSRAIRAIQSLRHLANKRSYSYNQHDVDLLFDTLAGEVGKSRNVFIDNNKSGDIIILKE